MKNLLEFDENLNDLRIYFNDRHLIEFKKFIIDKNYDDAKNMRMNWLNAGIMTRKQYRKNCTAIFRIHSRGIG